MVGIRIKGCHALKWGTCNTEQQYSIVVRQRTSVGFKLVVHGGTGAGGLVVPLPCTAYFGKSAIYCLAISCHSKHRPNLFLYSYHSLA